VDVDTIDEPPSREMDVDEKPQVRLPLSDGRVQ